MTPLVYIIILAVIGIFASTITVLWRNENNQISTLISKSIINFVIIYLAIMSFALNEGSSALFEGLILLGLVAGLLGDIFFCYLGEDKTKRIERVIFTTKIVSYFMFLIAVVHITTVSWLYGFVFGVILTIFASFSDKIFKTDTTKYKWLFPIYAIIIGTVFAQCLFQVLLASFSVVNLLALIGFAVLVVSDIVWLCDLFGKKKAKSLQTISSIMHYISQIIIASLIFFV